MDQHLVPYGKSLKSLLHGFQTKHSTIGGFKICCIFIPIPGEMMT